MIDGPVFTATIKSGFVKSFDFRGRASRPDYWYWFLFIFLGQMISAFLDGELRFIFVLVTFVPTLAVTVRRMHDMDRTGWWILIGLVPGLGDLALLIWLTLPGTYYPNRYGDPIPART